MLSFQDGMAGTDYGDGDRASRLGHLELIKMQATKCCCSSSSDARWDDCAESLTFTPAAMDGAASKGYLDVVRWLHHNRLEGGTSEGLLQAVANGHVDVVQWLLANRGENDVWRAVGAAAAAAAAAAATPGRLARTPPSAGGVDRATAATAAIATAAAGGSGGGGAAFPTEGAIAGVTAATATAATAYSADASGGGAFHGGGDADAPFPTERATAAATTAAAAAATATASAPARNGSPLPRRGDDDGPGQHQVLGALQRALPPGLRGLSAREWVSEAAAAGRVDVLEWVRRTQRQQLQQQQNEEAGGGGAPHYPRLEEEDREACGFLLEYPRSALARAARGGHIKQQQ
ncbi:conserved unknown protein [Ectocarpus siliculosus]|uniref:Uncharacterized protein n=1 Tax=Ectocarpus siliculosus TaxID=2880 RepID=D7FZJ3_ECTSI|nr:conserved unknown protein [Ectocarpus siliculosus]|eukprot:CBJ32800.1 conserved unknown protein [Ectocarpus siliculosus]